MMARHVEACQEALSSGRLGFGGRLEATDSLVTFESSESQRYAVEASLVQRFEALYSEATTAEAAAKVVETACRTYAAPGLPATLEAARAALLPQLWPAAKVAEKQTTLGAAVILPHCGLHGEEEGDYDVRVVVVYDSMPTDMALSVETPVLSRELAAWGRAFVDVLRIAMDNLRLRTKAMEGRPGFDERFTRHPTGCDASAWNDRYDAARCALLPSIVAKRPRAEAGGAAVCIFATRSCALATSARNVLGLCYAGDLCATKLEVNVSASPYRLVKVRAPSDGRKHPLVQKAGEGVTWKWQKYVPSVASGEFCVPRDAEQASQVLNAIEKGGPLPVFGDVSDASRAQEHLRCCEARKAEGNAKFAAGDFRSAAAAYSAGLNELDDDLFPFFEDRVAASKTIAATRANLAAALLAIDDNNKEQRAAEALRQASKALELDPHYAKAHARCASAFEALGESRAAAESRALAAQCAARDKRDRLDAANAAQAARQAELERREEVKKKRALPRRQEDAIPRTTTIEVDASIDPFGLIVT